MLHKLFGLGLAVCALACAGPGRAADPELVSPSAADFGARPVLLAPQLAPDGLHVAAEGLIEGKPVVLLVDISGPQRRVNPVSLPEGHQIEWMRWAGPERLLVSVSRKADLMGDEVRMTRLVELDLGSGKVRFVGPSQQGVDGDDVIFVDRAGAFLLLSTQPTIYDYPAVFRVDLSTGKSERIVTPREHVWAWYADSTGAVRAGMGIDGAEWWLLYRQKDGEMFKRTVSINGNRGEDSNVSEFFLVAGSDQGYAVATAKSGRLALFRYDFLKDDLGELVYEHPSVDIDTFDIDQAGAVKGVFLTDEHAETIWYDPVLKHQQERIDRALPGLVNRIVSVSEDKMRMMVWSGAADRPGDYLLLDRKTGEMALFAQPYSQLTDKRLSTVKPVRYKARDGLEIRGYLTLPAGRDPKGLPLIVMPHGGPYIRDELSFDPQAQYLASRGYAVLQPNFRGSTGFGRNFVEKGTGQWGRAMQDDLDDGVKWLAGEGVIDPKRVCIMGGSYGGYAAQWAAVRNPEIYRCAISFAGVSDLASQLRFSRGSFIASRYFRNWRERIQGTKDFDLDQISPLRLAARMTVPILIAHGTEDDTVPISQSRRLHGALTQLGRPHDYVEYKGEGHGFDNPANATDFYTRIGAFLDKHNPP
ncbi:S9 family peptidase [Sphingomonas sp. LB-2]|uniref:alpha/beta hydrolase family protein n=1 Tax=Sphingomonas caeni TaxID=2984949 RepID=UPI002231B648|nr:S9 family peptidase [Sphingomonas caeni]MCW3847018.1 S9 family peptidase [Sphingomonas caeni]